MKHLASQSYQCATWRCDHQLSGSFASQYGNNGEPRFPYSTMAISVRLVPFPTVIIARLEELLLLQ